ncbi:Peptidase aspartic [Macrophomina phaseolina MS6]|uniref:Peptidase aspartic n=1 Tax=Macrophomina phaseolina (strain MS6) TaxID=1126212 RepID=K2S1C9_MACPH|nr:Peptidase aspartic [Macrophomina phaseolina MS6]
MVSRTSNTEILTGLNLWKQFKTKETLNGRPISILIDTGSSGNFIHNEFMEQCKILYRKKKEPYPLSGFDGKSSVYGEGWVKIETEKATLQIKNHREQISLDVQRIPGHNIILGNSDSGISQNQDCDAEGEASLVKCNPIAGISPTKRNDTLESSREEQDSNDGVRPSVGSINGNLEEGLRQDQDYSVRNAASSVKYSASSGVSPTESSIPENQVQHLSRRTTRRKRKAKSLPHIHQTLTGGAAESTGQGPTGKAKG